MTALYKLPCGRKEMFNGHAATLSSDPLPRWRQSSRYITKEKNNVGLTFGTPSGRGSEEIDGNTDVVDMVQRTISRQ